MASEIPRVKFDNSYECPILGIGTWKVCSNQLRLINCVSRVGGAVIFNFDPKVVGLNAGHFFHLQLVVLSIMTTENLFLLASTFPLHIYIGTYNKFPEFQGF